MTPAEIAEAFSRHRFAETYPHLAEDVRWVVIGDREIVGRAAVIEACERSAGHLAGITTTFRRFRVVVGTGTVVVDSEAAYAGPDGTAVVASCDLYDVPGSHVTGITSYTVQLPDPAP